MDVLLPSRSTSPVLNAISLTTYPIPNGGGNSGRRLLAAEGTDAGSMHQPGAMQQPAAIQQPALRQPAALAPVPPPPPPRPPRRLARGELNALMHDAFRAEHQQARRRRALQQAADAPNSTGALPPPLPGTTPPPPAPVAPILDFASLSTVDGTGGSIYVVTTTGVELNKSAAVVNVLPADLAAQVEGIVGQLKQALTFQTSSTNMDGLWNTLFWIAVGLAGTLAAHAAIRALIIWRKWRMRMFFEVRLLLCVCGARCQQPLRVLDLWAEPLHRCALLLQWPRPELWFMWCVLPIIAAQAASECHAASKSLVHLHTAALCCASRVMLAANGLTPCFSRAVQCLWSATAAPRWQWVSCLALCCPWRLWPCPSLWSSST